MLMQWQETFSVGIFEIDQQHKKLIDMLNTFYDHMKQDNKTAMGELLNSMAKYAVTHFKTEETLFDQYGYPETAQHKKEHAAFVAEVQSVQSRLKEGKMVLSMELTTFLKEWLTNHILGSDKKYAPFLNGKGVK